MTTRQQGLFKIDTEEYAGALFDDERIYRYLLWRRWSSGKPILWIMLNPSTADEHDLDNTLRRCLDFSVRWGFPAMEIVNLYAYISTEPKVLPKLPDPIGRFNFMHMDKAVARASKVMVGWGTNAKPDVVARAVKIFESNDTQPYCLKITTHGHPIHPLYQPKHLTPVPWRPKGADPNAR